MAVGITELEDMIRKGTVQSVNSGELKARVKFGDKGGIISGDLHILDTGTNWTPEIGSMVLCLMIPGGDGEGYILGGIK